MLEYLSLFGKSPKWGFHTQPYLIAYTLDYSGVPNSRMNITEEFTMVTSVVDVGWETSQFEHGSEKSQGTPKIPAVFHHFTL